MGWFKNIFKRPHPSHQYRQDGFKSFDKAFNSHPDTPELDHEMEILIKVRIVGDYKKFTWKKAQMKEAGIVGYASHPPNKIELLGKIVNGRIVLHQAVAGHEFQHILSWASPGKLIANPDKLKRLFLIRKED